MSDDLARTVRIAARALGRAGLVHAYGHCSARVDGDSFLVCPSVPMEHVPVGGDCPRVPVLGDLPAGVLGEVRLHQQIYARRPEAGGEPPPCSVRRSRYCAAFLPRCVRRGRG